MMGVCRRLQPAAEKAPDFDGPPHAWGVVLAGGKGKRLAGLTRRLYGEDRPKQYAVLTGPKSLLRQTLDRVGLLVPPQRTVVVTMAGQGSYVTAELRHESQAPHVLEQPKDRGTAAAVLLAAHRVVARDPEAILVVLPSDHFVSDDEAFMAHIADAVEFLEDRHPERIVLLGAQPSEAETDYGWIELGEPLARSGRSPMYRVRSFSEKPSQATADLLFGCGALWNTFVFAGRAAAIVEAGRACLPSLHERLTRLNSFLGTEHEGWALGQAYELAQRASFSRAILERCPDKLAVIRLSGVSWCDLGTPERVAKTLDELGIQPEWAAAIGAAG
jgi:mannose-1-phosphate guanylyltransferase